jgi:peptidylprolyl isomerase
MAVGEPPAHPDRMLRVRVMADMAPAERPHVEAIDTRSSGFRNALDRIRRERGADFSPCDVPIRVRPAKGL